MSNEKLFPIQGEYNKYPQTFIPWWLAEIAYEEYSGRYGSRQTLNRIAERGGFGREELLMLLRKDTDL